MILKVVNPIVVDFETFFDTKRKCSIRPDMKKGWVGGPWHYTHHKEFYPYMVSSFDPVTKQTGVLDDLNGMRKWIGENLCGRTIISHNAQFEAAIIRWLVPDFEFFNMIDTADLSAYLQCPRDLAGAAHYLLGKEKNKDIRNSVDGVHYRDLDAAAKQRMKEYAIDDSVTAGEIYLQYFNKWPELEWWVSQYTHKQNHDGLHIDMNHVEEQIDRMNKIKSKSLSEIPWCETDEDKPLSAKKLAIWCREQGLECPTSLAEDSEECIAWEAKYGGDYPAVAAMRDWRKANTFLKKLDRIVLNMRPNGTMPLDLLYCAAEHTGRFSSRGVNVQNLPKSVEFCDLRGCLIPPPGQAFIGADLAGIEARCLPYLAGDMEYLKEVARLDAEAPEGETGDLYEPHARRMFQYNDPQPLKKGDKDLRFATKTCVLALGYQSGARKFLKTISNEVPESVLRRVSQGGENINQLSIRLVRLYRQSNNKIPDLWYTLDRELRAACATGVPFKMQLPMGRVIHYWDLAIREGQDQEGRARSEVVGVKCKGEEPVKLYGGKLTENACQAFARDVFVQKMYDLYQVGLKVAFTVHDEHVIPVPKDEANAKNRRLVEKVMSETPSWAPELPLAAETSIMERYAK